MFLCLFLHLYFLYLYLCVCICVVTEYTLNLSFPTPPFCLIATPQVRVIAVAKVVLLAFAPMESIILVYRKSKDL